MTDRRDFLASVRASLGRSSDEKPVLSSTDIGVSASIGERRQRAEQVRAVMAERAGDLLEELAKQRG